MVKIGAGLYAGWTGFVFVCNVQVPVVRISGWVDSVCLCVMYRSQWSGTPGGRISGWDDTNDCVFMCHVQVSLVRYTWRQDFWLG